MSDKGRENKSTPRQQPLESGRQQPASKPDHIIHGTERPVAGDKIKNTGNAGDGTNNTGPRGRGE